MRILILLGIMMVAGENMVGWYVTKLGVEDPTYPLDMIDWGIYTHIRYGYPVVYMNGTTACNKSDILFKRLVKMAHKHGRKVQWGPGIPSLGKILWSNNETYLNNYYNSIGIAARECDVDGIGVDYEFDDSKYGKLGIVTPEESTIYSRFLANIKRLLGEKRTVSADISIWGFGKGEWWLGVLPWVNVTMLNRGDWDFVNVMSYHWSIFGNIWAYKKDGFFIDEWGMDRKRVNIGIPYFSTSFWEHSSSEPLWKTLSEKCPNIDPAINICNGTVFVGKRMNYKIGEWIREKGFGGAFPWAMNYDTPYKNNSLVQWLWKGIKNGE